MVNTVSLIAAACAAIASLLFAALAATFDADERTWRPLAAFGGYCLVVPLVVYSGVKRSEPPTAGAYLATAIVGTVVNSLAVFVALCNGSLDGYIHASPAHSRQVLTLTGVSAVIFILADLLLVSGMRPGPNEDDRRYRDEDGVSSGERQALLGDFGGAAPASRAIDPAAAAAAESMTAAVRAYDTNGERTPEEREEWAGAAGEGQGHSPQPIQPGVSGPFDGTEAAAAGVAHPTRALDFEGGVPPPATVADRQAAATPEVQYHSAVEAEEEEDGDGPASRTSRDNIDSDEAAEIELAATHYNDSYRDLMLQMTAPDEADNAQPFIGFSLTDNVREGHILIDGIFEAGPAFQVGVDVDHELVSIAGYPVSYMEDVGPLIRKYCRVGHITTFVMRNGAGKPYEAQVWVMTAEARYAGKTYYFDRSAHQIRQSDRLKNTWRPSEDRLRGPSIADDEL